MHSSDPSNQIPWFATSHGHIDLGTSKDWREQKKEDRNHEKPAEKKKEETQKNSTPKSDELNKTSAGSLSRRKDSTTSYKVGVGGLPPLAQKPAPPIIEENIIFPLKTISYKDLQENNNFSSPKKNKVKIAKVK